MTDPRVSVPKADENTRGFEVALVWFTPGDEKLARWTKRVIVMELKKAVSLLRDPNEDDLPLIARIKSIANTIPVSSASRDGEFTWRV